jgi:hypothetical protein
MSSPVRSEIHGVGRSKPVLAPRTGPWDPVHWHQAGNDGHIWGRRSNPTETATTNDNLTTTRSVNHTQVEVESRMSNGRLWER